MCFWALFAANVGRASRVTFDVERNLETALPGRNTHCLALQIQKDPSSTNEAFRSPAMGDGPTFIHVSRTVSTGEATARYWNQSLLGLTLGSEGCFQ
ncbi:MAG TPA: hypothetical protein DEF45_04195 [Rhodopirellula sp.]|nr:hypothetical protein [Rhodopirellula sp.]